MFYLISFLSGCLFAAGMLVSDMVNPAKVMAFLDIFGAWDPSLAFVMGGALLVFLPSYQLIIKKRKQPVLAAHYSLPTNNKIDVKLLGGACLFGLGWGLSGLCPGPAITSLAGANPQILLFVLPMLLGVWLMPKILRLFNTSA